MKIFPLAPDIHNPCSERRESLPLCGLSNRQRYNDQICTSDISPFHPLLTELANLLNQIQNCIFRYRSENWVSSCFIGVNRNPNRFLVGKQRVVIQTLSRLIRHYCTNRSLGWGVFINRFWAFTNYGIRYPYHLDYRSYRDTGQQQHLPISVIVLVLSAHIRSTAGDQYTGSPTNSAGAALIRDCIRFVDFAINILSTEFFRVETQCTNYVYLCHLSHQILYTHANYIKPPTNQLTTRSPA